MAGADGSTSSTGISGVTVAGDTCDFTVNHTPSPAIGTVQIVNWFTTLPNVSEAHIDFGLTGSELATSAPVDLAEPGYRTLLLGMKGDRSYSFRIVASSGATSCTSAELSFTTGPAPDAPIITKSGSGSGASQGFIIATSGLNAPLDSVSVFIFDTDGDVVWWTTNDVLNITGARMSWDGKTMYSVCAYANDIFGVSMDGVQARAYPELNGANHDLAVLPDGGVATMVAGTRYTPSTFAEMKADGTVVTIVPDLELLFEYDDHANAVHYYPEDDSFTLSNLYSTIVKFKRTGEIVWRIGGEEALTDALELNGLEPWRNNHGHHLTADDHLLIYSNFLEDDPTNPSTPFSSGVVEVRLDEEAATATKTWEYADGSLTEQLGDVQRLPNGNVLITHSNIARVVEVTPSGDVVQSFDNQPIDGRRISFGYTMFRTSLYGPPPR